MSASVPTITTGIRERHADAIEKIMSKYPIRRSGVMDVLYLVQDEMGWIPPEVMPEIAEICEMESSEVMEMVTFYTMYHRKPVGKHVLWVCGTLPCALCGSDGLMKYLQEKLGCGMDEVSPDGNFTIKRAECLGACSEAPLLLVDGQMQTRLTRAKVDDMLERLRNGKALEKPVAASPDLGIVHGAQKAKSPGKKPEPVQAKVAEEVRPSSKPSEPVSTSETAKPESTQSEIVGVPAPASEHKTPKVAAPPSEPASGVETNPEAPKAIEAKPVTAPAKLPQKEVATVGPKTVAKVGAKEVAPVESKTVAKVEPKEVVPADPKTLAPVEPKPVVKAQAKPAAKSPQTLPQAGEDRKKTQAAPVVRRPAARQTGPTRTVAVYRKPSSGDDSPPDQPAPLEVTDLDLPPKKPKPPIVQKVLEKPSGSGKPVAPLPKFSGSFTDRVMATVKASQGGEDSSDTSGQGRQKSAPKSAKPAGKKSAEQPGKSAAGKNPAERKASAKPPRKDSGKAKKSR